MNTQTSHYTPQFLEVMERAKNLRETTSKERRQLLAELFYLSVQTGSQFDHLTGRPLNWYNWHSVVKGIERLRTEYENQ